MTDIIPYWADQAVSEFLDQEPRWNESWQEIGHERFAKVVAIHYPPVVMVYYIVERLADGDWEELAGTHFSEELASSAARKKAYYDQIPHRVRMVVQNA